MPSRLSRFWQELKRRNVIRVLTVYAGAAFIIIELVNNITEPLRLPEWTPTLVIIILLIGFPLAVFFSWIFEVSPEGGLVKTEPAHKVRETELPKTSKGWKIASYISFVVIVGLIIINLIPRSGKIEIANKSIAILPFRNLSEDEENIYFTDGLVEDLLNRISVVDDLKVISRTSSEIYRERGAQSVPEIAAELGVSYIVEGSVQRYGARVRITVQLIDAENDDHIWADSYDRDIIDIFQTESEIATQIASELNTILTSNQKSHLQESKTENLKAFELYQLGRYFWNKRTGDGYTQSIEYFRKAIAEDPGYGLAYAGLADSYHLMALQDWIDYKEGMDKAVELAMKALELDENLAEAYTVLGSVYDHIDFDWKNAEKSFIRALDLNPNYATAHQYYAEHLNILGRHEEARLHINKALDLNPYSFIIRYTSMYFFYNQGLFEQALSELKKCHELEEGHPWLENFDLFIYYQLGEEEKAFEIIWNRMNEPPVIHDLNLTKKIYEESGMKGVIEYDNEVIIRVSEGGEGYYLYLANFYGLIGEEEKAREWFDKYIKNEEYLTPSITYNLHFKNLHNTQEYVAALEKMGLVPQ